MAKPNLLGPWGEALAAEFLRKRHYEVVACNYRSRFGEIDLIARNKKMIVFVEVKLRKNDQFVQAREYVGIQKQERIRSTALMWLQTHPTELQPRFDVIEIYASDGIRTAAPKIIHLEDAFQ